MLNGSPVVVKRGTSRRQRAAVNWERKRSQTASGARLRALRRRWAQLVSDSYRRERALLQLKAQLEKEKSQATNDDGEASEVDMEAVKSLLDKLNTQKEMLKEIEDMFVYR